MEYAIKRSFARRGEDAFASLTVKADVAHVTIDGSVLPSSSVEYLLNFAFQSLQDAYAGAKTRGESASLFEKKLGKLLDGTIGSRSGGESVSDEVRHGRLVVGEILRAKNKAKWAELKDLPADEKNAELDAILEKNAKALAGVIAERINEERAKRERNAGLSLDI